MKTLTTATADEIATLDATEMAYLRVAPEHELRPAEVRAGMVTADGQLKPSLLTTGGELKAGLNTNGPGGIPHLKPSLLDQYGELKAGVKGKASQ